MEKEIIEKRYMTIGEVSEMLDVNPSLIRFWEQEFPQLTPRKNRKGNRIYTQEDLETLRNIYYLVKVRKFTLKGAREKLKANPQDLQFEQRTRETLLRVRGFLTELRESL
jgi:DNA-binding transcriptional MerR regulator